MRKRTRLIHGGVSGDILTGAISTPIYQTSTYQQDDIGKHRGYEYSRTKNPTRFALEELVKDLEGGVGGFAFASGMAAITTVMMLFRQGDHLIFSDDVYGGTYRIMTKVLQEFGVEASFVDTTSIEEVKKHIQANTKAIYVEVPTNPLLKVADIKAISLLAKGKNLLTIVDNTFLTPYLFQPLSLGANIVVHSATKYLGGHSDVVAGIVVVDSEELKERMHFLQNATGAILGPQDSWLLQRGIRTLGLRMDIHESNAREIAAFLRGNQYVKKVYYPNLGGMISFEVTNEEIVAKLVKETKYFTLAESLGAVESLISVPAKMTHASIPKERRESLGITDCLVRISVGVEDVRDLLEDLQKQLCHFEKKKT